MRAGNGPGRLRSSVTQLMLRSLRCSPPERRPGSPECRLARPGRPAAGRYLEWGAA